MNKSFTLIGTAVFAGMGLVASNALAASFTWNGGASGAWDVNSNWLPNTGFPDSVNDDVTISGSVIVTVKDNGMSGDNVIIVGKLTLGDQVTLNVRQGETLFIDNDGTGSPSQPGQLILQASSSSAAKIAVKDAAGSGGTLKFGDNDGTSDHEIGGDIVLEGDDSVMQVTTDNAVFDPYFNGSESTTYYGLVKGEHDSAQFSIDSVELDYFIDLSGHMQILDGGGSPKIDFQNDVEILVDAAGTLSFGAGLDIGDTTLTVWDVGYSSGGAVLQFNEDDTFVGKFYLYNENTIELATAGIDVVFPDITDSDGMSELDGTLDAFVSSTSDDTTLTWDSVTCGNGEVLDDATWSDGDSCP